MVFSTMPLHLASNEDTYLKAFKAAADAESHPAAAAGADLDCMN